MEIERLESILSSNDFVVIAPSFVFAYQIQELGDILHKAKKPQALLKYTNSFAQLDEVLQPIISLANRYFNAHVTASYKGHLINQAEHFSNCADFQDSRIRAELASARKGAHFRSRSYKSHAMEKLRMEVINYSSEDLESEMNCSVRQVRKLSETIQQLADSMLVVPTVIWPYTKRVPGSRILKLLFGLLIDPLNSEKTGSVVTRNHIASEAFQQLLELTPYSQYQTLRDRAKVEVFPYDLSEVYRAGRDLNPQSVAI